MVASTAEERSSLLPRYALPPGAGAGGVAGAATTKAGGGPAARPPITGSARVTAAAVASVSWMFVSNLLILINKRILRDLEFSYPITVGGSGMAASGLLAFVVVRVLRLAEANTQLSLRFYATRIMPVGFFMALTLFTGNAVYMHLTVSFIQMLKAFTPVITMAALFVSGVETPRRQMVLAVLVIAGGTAVTAWGEVNLSMVGLALMFTSETAEAIRLVMTQTLLCGLQMGPFEGVMLMAPACCFWLALGAAVREWPAIAAAGAWSIVAANWPIFALSATLGFAINVLAFITIRLASSLTLKVLANVKSALLVAASVAFFGEVVTAVQAAGYTTASAAFIWYTYMKVADIKAGA